MLQEELARRKNEIKDAKLVSFSARRNYYSVNSFFPAILHRFEDSEFYIPNDYDTILKKVYGNYMELPPEDKRAPHHIQDAYWK